MSIPLRCRIRAEVGVTRVDLYDDIGEDPWFGGGISAASFLDKLSGVRGPLDVHICSSGGMVDQGLAIYNALVAHKGPVATYNDGLAASVASVIMQAGTRRVMAPVSALMIHDAWGDPGPGDAAHFKAIVDALSKNSDIIARAYAGRAGGTVQQWRERMQATTWYDADDALAAGLIDEVAEGVQPSAPIDLIALAASAPVKIMARLRAQPVIADAAPQHPPLSVTHSHKGPNGEAEQEHTHDGDASHEGVYDPDNDGDDDSTAEGDTDHDYVLPNGKPGPKALTEDRLRAVIREELRAALRNADKYDTEDRKRMAGKEAMPDGSYPVADAEDLDNAIHAVGRGGADHDAIRAHIIKRAAALGLSSKIPDNWGADGSLTSGTSNLAETEFLAFVTRELNQLDAGRE